MAAATLNLDDVQGLVYSGYQKLPFAGFLLARLADGAPAASRAWLRELPVASAARPGLRSTATRMHVAFAASGLAALGVDGGALDGLPQELKEGMAARAQILGDQPGEWTLGGPDDRIDVLLAVYAASPAARDEAMAVQRERLGRAGATVRPDEIAWELSAREHFGFADGLSQPFVPGLHTRPRAHEQPIALGEMLLGYPNGYGQLAATPRDRDGFDLGANGTYIVFRKLAQDVGGLWRYLASHARDLGTSPEHLGAKLVGRWPSGAPVVLAPHADDPGLVATPRVNDFGYLQHDPDGHRCPIAAHIRRANPRDAREGDAETSLDVVNRHRILRRGRSWGAPLSIDDAIAGRDDGAPRGLYFLALGASIARGFEFIQQSWLGNPGFLGLGGEVDPFTGPGRSPFTIPAHPIRVRLPPMPRFVTTLGGGYFFLPSLGALRRIAGA